MYIVYVNIMIIWNPSHWQVREKTVTGFKFHVAQKKALELQ